ncbi:MAG: NADH-quinone oxidoreductase subunit A [Oligoflexia bacterium]|nr:NADH-quinone oxidoreductase subunit A [Oligoflexia bacterium]MBF0364107.1 NADH-quinone oxidoreductase subunit A [Oligoflexia bacterium]
MESYLLSYLSLAMVIVVAMTITVAILILNHLLGQRPQEVTKVKGENYECGVPSIGNARQQFSVRYYLVAIIFLIFDVDVVLMFPWALVYKKLLASGPMIIIEMVIFALVLFVGYLYVRMRGALNWD